VERMAETAGCHFFKCPLCNNRQQFSEEMQQFGNLFGYLASMVIIMLQVSTCLTKMLSGRLDQPMMTNWRDMAAVMLSLVCVLMVTSMMRMTQSGRSFSAAAVELRYSAAVM
jgi:branched-subunit amino acid ABC-type transport system permease component